MCRKFKWFLVMVCVNLMLITGCGEKEASDLREITSLEEEQEETQDEAQSVRRREESEENSAKGQTADIYVDVRGEVKNPGVYCLKEGSRVFEAVEAAGGITGKAADHAVNQAEKMTDGQQIYIPSKKEMQASFAESDGTAATEKDQGKVNLNTASKEELMTLGGIGEAKAEAILRYREEHGNFRSIEDIKKIEGIKEGVFQKVKDQITV